MILIKRGMLPGRFGLEQSSLPELIRVLPRLLTVANNRTLGASRVPPTYLTSLNQNRWFYEFQGGSELHLDVRRAGALLDLHCGAHKDQEKGQPEYGHRGSDGKCKSPGSRRLKNRSRHRDADDSW
jgi:hypothetical protein